MMYLIAGATTTRAHPQRTLRGLTLGWVPTNTFEHIRHATLPTWSKRKSNKIYESSQLERGYKIFCPKRASWERVALRILRSSDPFVHVLLLWPIKHSTWKWACPSPCEHLAFASTQQSHFCTIKKLESLPPNLEAIFLVANLSTHVESRGLMWHHLASSYCNLGC